MNSDILVQLLQKGFRVTLGATASLIEVLQDPQKREENLSKLRTDLSQLAEELAEKGAITEQEARSFVDTILSQQANQTSTETSASTATATTPTTSPNVQLELQELTAQIAAIRAELENLRDQDSAS
jgi:polyhydroxyalkanoate synthesis regulator phasin